MSFLRCLPVLILSAGPACAQASLTEVADLLAAVRLAKVECNVRAQPARLNLLVRAQGQRVEDFLPGRRHYGLVSNSIERWQAGFRSGDRRSSCARLAEHIRSSPLNRPQGEQTNRRNASRRDGRVDLNRAPIDELNSLGAGLIGRAIVYGRPYSSPEDLVDKRILTHGTFARIRNRVTVR